jgi:hypothetical protein
MKVPPFDGHKEALKDWTLRQLWRQDDEARSRMMSDLKSVFSPDLYEKTRYRFAKGSARQGNPGPLGAILSAKLGDPEIAEFIAAPRPGRGHDHRLNMREHRQLAVDTMQRIHAIWRQEYGRWKRRDKLAEDIACEYCDQTRDEIARALKRR